MPTTCGSTVCVSEKIIRGLFEYSVEVGAGTNNITSFGWMEVSSANYSAALQHPCNLSLFVGTLL